MRVRNVILISITVSLLLYGCKKEEFQKSHGPEDSIQINQVDVIEPDEEEEDPPHIPIRTTIVDQNGNPQSGVEVKVYDGVDSVFGLTNGSGYLELLVDHSGWYWFKVKQSGLVVILDYFQITPPLVVRQDTIW